MKVSHLVARLTVKVKSVRAKRAVTHVNTRELQLYSCCHMVALRRSVYASVYDFIPPCNQSFSPPRNQTEACSVVLP